MLRACRLRYVPTEAGECELHVWVDVNVSGVRSFLPSCPFPLHVSPGRPKAAGSFVADTNIAKPEEHTNGRAVFTAGDRLSIKLQLRDEYGNNAPLVTAGLGQGKEMHAYLRTPTGEQPLTLKNAVHLHESGSEHAPPELKKEKSKKGGGLGKVETSVGLYARPRKASLVLLAAY